MSATTSFTTIFQHSVSVERISRISHVIFHYKAVKLRGLICAKVYLLSKPHKVYQGKKYQVTPVYLVTLTKTQSTNILDGKKP